MKIIGVLLLCSMYIACAPSFYSPNQQNVPAFQKRGQAVVNASVGFDGYDFQSAYALTDCIALQLNGMSYAQNDEYLKNIPMAVVLKLELDTTNPFPILFLNHTCFMALENSTIIQMDMIHLDLKMI